MTDTTASSELPPAEAALIDAAADHAAVYADDDRPCITADVMNAFFAGAAFERGRMQPELDQAYDWLDRSNALVAGACAALKGAPPPELDMSYSTHDLPEWAAAAVAAANAALEWRFGESVETRENLVLAGAAWRTLLMQQERDNAKMAKLVAQMERADE
jgi:hypothetical protein